MINVEMPPAGDGPVVVYGLNVMDPSKNQSIRAQVGLTINELAPRISQPFICVFNGEPALRDDWDYVPSSDDHVVFVALPTGIPTAVWWVIAAIVFVVAAVALAPAPQQVNQSTQNASPTYTIQLSGNSARLGQPLPVPYGRHIIMPDFASQPYIEYDSNGDQYYNALMCVGLMDKFAIEQVAIDDTNISHFTDVEMQWVGPQFTDKTVTLINPAVVTAPEAANNDLNYGEYTGPFTVCGPGLSINKIGVDVLLPRGLYFANDDGSLADETVEWMVEARAVSVSGGPSGNWFLLGTHSLTLNTNSPTYRTYSYTVSPGRYEVRAQRTNVRDDNSRSGNDLQLAGLRGYLTSAPALHPSANFLALRMKATSQLSGTSERKLTVIVRRQLPTYNPSTGWSAAVETSSIAWAVADILRNDVYGAGLPDSRIDLQSLYELDNVWKARYDEFNGVFDKLTTVWDALQTVLRVGRARPIMRGSVVTFVRDQQQDLPTSLFNLLNIEKGSFSVEYRLWQEDANDGVEVEFFNSQTWASDWVTVPMPGGDVEDVVNPIKVNLQGITDYNHAMREALYMAADIFYRRTVAQFTTELNGYLPAYGDLVAVAHDVTGWGYSGEIVEYDGTSATTSEYLTWTVGDHYVILVSSQGDLAGPYKIKAGDTPYKFEFIELPGIVINTSLDMERTRYALGPASSFSKYCKAMEISPSGNDRIQFKLVVEDNRVHAADSEFLIPPVGGDGGSGGSGSGGGSNIAVYAPDEVPAYSQASDAQHSSYGFYSDDDFNVATGVSGKVYSS